MEDEALVTKVICLVLFAVISLSCGLLPLAASRLARCWRRRRTDKTEVRLSGRLNVLLSCVLCLGGGVLMGTVFTHMLPEIRDIFAQIEGADLLPGMQPSAGEIFLCVGFFLVYLVEELVHAFLAGRAAAKKQREVASTAAASPSAVVVQVHGDRDAMSWHERYAESAPAPAVVVDSAAHEHDHGAAGHDHGAVIATLQAFRAYIVIVALSVHSVFEGFAVAFETTSRDVWVLFAAIATHKAIVAFCLGEQLLATKRSVCFIVTNLLLLSAASPLGVTIGLAVEQLDQDESSRLLCTGVLQALAAGTILYVVFFEILGPERQKHGAGLLKFLAVVAGFALIVLMHSSGGHSHGGPALRAHGSGHGGHAQGHAHGEGHDHGASEPVNSDYLARVPNESGHVYDTVRYIKSFSRQEVPEVDPGDIVAGMRSIVEDLGSGHDHGDHQEDHGADDDHSHDSESVSSSEREGSGHEHAEGATRKPPRACRHKERHSDDHAEADSSGDGELHAHEEEGGSHHHHYHDHDQFMRTVAELAGRLRGMDRQAVDRTVSLIDTLDLIAMQKTVRGLSTDHEHGENADEHPPHGGWPGSGHGHDHDHDRDHDHDHDHGPHPTRSTVPPGASEAAETAPDRGRDHLGLHAEHFRQPSDGHVQFVLQDPSTERAPVRVRSPSPSPSPSPGSNSSSSSSTSQPASGQHEMSADAERYLQEMVEVKYHKHDGHVHEERSHAPAHRSPTPARSVPVT